MRLPATPGRVEPRATYRLQLRGGMDFRQAETLVPYLAALGVSHVYCSPWVRARAGSSHGYDVVDPRQLDPELGDEADLASFVAALRRHGMGQILDWVPNHVGIGRGENPWWQEVLAFGRDSPYADFFDIDWSPGRPALRGKVLLPVLGAPYGEVLEKGELEPEADGEGGLVVRYFEHRFPVSPASWGQLLASRLPGPQGDGEEAFPAEALRPVLVALSSRTGGRERRIERAREAQRALASLLADDAMLRARVDRAIASLRGEPGRPASWDRLHRLLEAQHYRLAYWRVASDEINYRRFFDIDELAAVRMERREVFDHVHESLFRWIDAGWIDGLRIDHVDGLADPAAYCERVRERHPPERLQLVVEKILAADESLPGGWPVDGTTGYEFLNQVNGLFVAPEGERPLDRLYRSFTSDLRRFDEVLRASKVRVMRALLASELDGLASALDRLAQGDRHTRDFTLRSLRNALHDTVAAFPVYRSYVGPQGAGPEDRARIARAVAAARMRADDPHSGLYDWLEGVLTGDLAASVTDRRRAAELRRFATRFEQYTAPVTAKGLEDTAFYRSHRLISLNEVGGDPRRFGVEPDEFHAANAERAARHPRGLLTTSTHDTKRGEDVRARIDVLSEWPAAWARRVRAWARITASRRRLVDGEPAPSRKDEYLLYQVLVGSFPLESPSQAVLQRYCERVQQYLVKALREGKERSSWRNPRLDYEAAVTELVADLLSPGSAFLEDFLPFQAQVAERGALNGLSQLVLKLTSPGVPDLYQGCEDWDLSLADPDNRRPVDFRAREAVLKSLSAEVNGDGALAPEALRELCRSWSDGRIKHWVTWRLLELRARRPGLLAGGGHAPLSTSGACARQLCAFARSDGDDSLFVIAPRLCASLPRARGPFPIGPEAWGDTRVALPGAAGGATWREVMSGSRFRPEGPQGVPTLSVAALFETLPVAVLEPATT